MFLAAERTASLTKSAVKFAAKIVPYLGLTTITGFGGLGGLGAGL